TSLARQLLEDGSYDRVQLGHWTEPFLRVLSPVLASSEAGTRELCLPDIGEFSHDSATALFTALESNRKITSLEIAVAIEPDARVILLCETLKTNQFIKFLNIGMYKVNSLNKILRALTVNRAITELQMVLQVAPVEEMATAFSDMLLRNNAITSI
ncbi:hypothetical protein MRX96_046012, partial [Rhipicephalus microplus]